MPDLVKPTFEEMTYRQKLLRNTRTMNFNHETIAFPREEWQKFLDEVVDNKYYFYRFIFCNGCNDFRGIALYRYDEKNDCYFCHVTVQADARREGYGASSLALLEKEAMKNGINVLYASVFEDNEEGCRFALKHGYLFDRRENGLNIYRKSLVQ